jgi:hypothetical protein
VRLENSHILNLDAPVKYVTSKVVTLCKYLMSRAPTSSVIHSIFASVDRSWLGNDFTLVTVKLYAADALKALNSFVWGSRSQKVVLQRWAPCLSKVKWGPHYTSHDLAPRPRPSHPGARRRRLISNWHLMEKPSSYFETATR